MVGTCPRTAFDCMCVCGGMGEGVLGWHRAGEWCPFPSESELRGSSQGQSRVGPRLRRSPLVKAQGLGLTWTTRYTGPLHSRSRSTL